MVAPVGAERGDQELYRYRKAADGSFEGEWLAGVRFVPMRSGTVAASEQDRAGNEWGAGETGGNTGTV